MHNIYNLVVGQKYEQIQEKAAPDATFQAAKTDLDLIDYLMILKRLCFSNKSEQHPIRSLCLYKRLIYNIMQYANENTTTYLFRLHNTQKVNEACNGSLVKKGVKDHGANIIFLFHNTGFDSLKED